MSVREGVLVCVCVCVCVCVGVCRAACLSDWRGQKMRKTLTQTDNMCF